MIKYNSVYKNKTTNQYLYCLYQQENITKCYSFGEKGIFTYYFSTIEEYFILIKEYKKEISYEDFFDEVKELQKLEIFR